MKKLSRREFCKKTTLSFGGALSAPYLSYGALTEDPQEDHFFIQIVVNGGWNPIYLFDGRPLKMTEEKTLVSALTEESTPYIGTNGVQALASPLTKELQGLKDYFSVLNGVVMATGFDGHIQNLNYLFTGNPFGGDSFVPYLNEKGKYDKTSITGILSGFLGAQVKNHGEIVPLAGETGKRLVGELKKAPIVNSENPMFEFIRSRYDELSKGKGRFSLANQKVLAAFDKQSTLYNQFKDLTFSEEEIADAEADMVALLAKMFSKKVARVAVINLAVGGPVDAHSPADIPVQIDLYEEITSKVSKIINLLRTTSYDDKRSLYDVTTFMVGSEFSRTLRGLFMTSFEESGTDHNQLSNSFLIGGKGIKTGQVIGATDFQNSNEQLSKSHLLFDPDRLKFMGKPFDFNKMEISKVEPENFDIENYLGMANVSNTIMSMFGVDSKYHWKKTNAGPKSQIISSLLK